MFPCFGFQHRNNNQYVSKQLHYQKALTKLENQGSNPNTFLTIFLFVVYIKIFEDMFSNTLKRKYW